MINFLALVLILPLTSFAWNCNPADPSKYQECIEEVEKNLAGPQIECDPSPAAAPETQCEKKYNQMFADGTLNVTIAGGYFDSNGTIADGVYGEYWSNLIREHLVKPCPATYELLSTDKYAGTDEEINGPKKDREYTGCGRPKAYSKTCGFKRTDDPEIFLKQIVVKGKSHSVRVRVLTSSLTSSDKQNRESRNKLIETKFCLKEAIPARAACVQKNKGVPDSKLKSLCGKGDTFIYQICKSEYVKNAWRDSIVNGDEIVVYDGHARDGGGPSFEPPKVTSDGHVHYSWYRKNKPGHKEEAKYFSEAVKKGKVPAVYASLSCNSHKNFVVRGSFPEVSKSTALVVSKRTSYPDEGLASLFSTIEGAVNRSCGEQLNESISGASCAFKLHNF